MLVLLRSLLIVCVAAVATPVAMAQDPCVHIRGTGCLGVPGKQTLCSGSNTIGKSFVVSCNITTRLPLLLFGLCSNISIQPPLACAGLCVLGVSFSGINIFPALGPIPFQIPNNRSLRGAKVCLQCVDLDFATVCIDPAEASSVTIQ